MRYFVLLLLTVSIVTANVLHVPSDYATISAAVEASSEADTILVSPGTYFNNIVLPAGSLTIASEYIFTLDSAAILGTLVEPSDSVLPSTRSILEMYDSQAQVNLVGLTLQNGQGIPFAFPDSTCGGAIYQSAGRLNIEHCLLQNNQSYKGGAVFAGGGATLSLRSCDVRENLSTLGGVHAIGATLEAIGTKFHDNFGHWGSGIMAWENAYVTLDSCLVDSAHNMNVNKWGAVLVIRSTVSVSNTDFISNWVDTSYFTCAGLAISQCSSRVENCRFMDNLGQVGTALEIGYRNAYIRNCLFLRNHASLGQGAFTLGPGTHSIVNCVFEQNSSPHWNTFTSLDTVSLDRCVFRNNFSTDSNDSSAVTSGYSHVTFMNNCSFVGNTPATIHNAYQPLGVMHMENCYWGDPSGPYHPTLNPNGHGGIIYGDSVYFTPWLTEPPQDVPEHSTPQIPTQITLDAFPNPFNPLTTLSFSLPVPSRVNIQVFDVLGRSVKTLTDEVLTAGDHRVTLDGSALPSGIYFARLQVGDFAQTRKMILLK